MGIYMGKRKTRKRSRSRKKRGGNYNVRAGERVCVWYGQSNEAKDSKDNPCTSNNLIDDGMADQIFPVGINHVGMWKAPTTLGYVYDPRVDYPLSEITQWYPDKFNDLDMLDKDFEAGTYNLYYVGHEIESASKDSKGDNRRFELLKFDNVKISKDPTNNSATFKARPWSDKMIVTFIDEEKINIKWGKTEMEKKVGTFWIESIESRERRGSHGG